MTDPRILSQEQIAEFTRIAEYLHSSAWESSLPYEDVMSLVAHIDAITEEGERLLRLVDRAVPMLDGTIPHVYQDTCPDDLGHRTRSINCPVCDWLEEVQG